MVKYRGILMEEKKDSYIDTLKRDLKSRIIEKVKNEILEEIYKELKEKEDILTDEVISLLDKRISSNIFRKEIKTRKIEGIKIQKAPHKEYQCQISIQTILKTAAHALKYANSNISRENWVEVIGLLAGKLDKNQKLHIEDAYPMGHGTALNAEVKDYKNFVKAFRDIKRNGLFICGWYHSHPSYGLFMSSEDITTQSRYQKLWEKAIALVIDPYQINGRSFGFEIFRANLSTQKWHKIPFKIKGSIDVATLPEFLRFINPLTDGKALFLEYDEE